MRGKRQASPRPWCARLFKLLLPVQDLLGKQVDDAPLQAVCQNNLISLQCSSGSLLQKKWLSAAIRKLEAFLDKVSSALGEGLG